MEGFLTFTAVLGAVSIFVVYMGVCIVPQGQEWTVERFGRYTRTLQSGLRFIMPFIDRIGRRITIMEQVLDVPEQMVITKDNSAVVADGVVFFRVDNVSKAAYEIQDLEMAIINLTTTNLRSVIGSMDLDQTLSGRDDINKRLLSEVDLATNPWGVKVVRIEIRDLRMSEELQNAMNQQMIAERQRRATVTEATGDKEAQVLRAQGLRDAAFLEAEAREREAQAEANATASVSKAIKEGDQNALQYFLGLKYIEALNEIGKSENSKLVLMPLEAAGVTGSIAGVGELLKNINIKAG